VSTGIGAMAKRNYSYGNGAVTIDGSLSAGTPFIVVGDTEKNATDKTEPTTKPGFLTYSDDVSNVWIGSVGDLVVTAPGAPQNFTATPGDTQVTLNWTAPESDGGSAITEYEVSKDDGASWTGVGLNTTYTFTGLINGTTYTFKVRAVNSKGPGAETVLPVKVDKGTGTASIDTGEQSLAQGGTVITIPSIPGVNTYSAGIPVPDLSTTDVQSTLTLDTKAGCVAVPSNMLTGVANTDGNKAQITIGQGDKSKLPEDIRNIIGDRPLVQLTLSIDGRQIDWFNPNAPVTISIPYAPTEEELANPEGIVIWYIDGSGNIVTIPNGRYNAARGTVTCRTTHFSEYAVAFNKVNFNDVTADAWYAPAVSFIAAREIALGTGDGKYSPDVQLSRGDFIVLMMRAYGIALDTKPADNFSDAGNTYYTGYLAAAKRLGIATGVGNNMFAPKKEITRQEMFTLLYNALKVIGQLPQNGTGKGLSDFSDAGQVAAWAKDAIFMLISAGVINGSNGKLFPLKTTTREEMAQVLYKLLGE
jgi:hypothetical protein